jgi:hypothetical protein
VEPVAEAPLPTRSAAAVAVPLAGRRRDERVDVRDLVHGELAQVLALVPCARVSRLMHLDSQRPVVRGEDDTRTSARRSFREPTGASEEICDLHTEAFFLMTTMTVETLVPDSWNEPDGSGVNSAPCFSKNFCRTL